MRVITYQHQKRHHMLSHVVPFIRLDLMYKICDRLACHFVYHFVLQRPEEVM